MGGFFGGEEKDTNFVGKITSHISKLIKQGEKKMEIGDRVWQPTFTNDIAYNSLILLANNKNGKYNMASHGSCSFFKSKCAIWAYAFTPASVRPATTKDTFSFVKLNFI